MIIRVKHKFKMHMPKLDKKTKSYLTMIGSSLIYFAMGLYFAAGNTGVYLSSYLIYRAESDMKLDDAIWFLSVAGFSAFFLPVGGWIESKVGVKWVCLIGGILQSLGIYATYFVLDTTFLAVVIVYGGSFLFSLATCYTSTMVNVCKWHPKHRGLVTGIGAASMAVAPSIFTPLVTYLVNPNNLPANSQGLFDDPQVLDRTKSSTLIQGTITLTLFLVGVALTFPAEPIDELDSEQETVRQEVKEVVTLIKYCDNLGKFELTKPKPNTKQTIVQFQNNKSCNQEGSAVNISYSIEPKFALRTSEFWLLSFKVLITELLLVYILFMYKPYGQTFIQDDYFLSIVGAACAISNTLGRISMGYFKDKFGYRAVSIPLSGIAMVFTALVPFTRHFNKLFYGIAIVVAIGAVGSQYGLTPSAAQDSFGDKYASINIGFVYMSTVVATVSSALLTQHLTSLIGWDGMIYLVASFAAVDFVCTFFMPTDPSKRLIQRYRQFYQQKVSDKPKIAVEAA